MGIDMVSSFRGVISDVGLNHVDIRIANDKIIRIKGISKIVVREGDKVEKGDLLGRLGEIESSCRITLEER